MTLPHLLPRAAATGLALLLASLLQAPGSDAATRAGFRVSANVTQGCLVNHAPPGNGGNLGNLGRLDFGRHPATSTARIGAQLTPNGAITLACTPGIALRMTVDGGQHATGGLRHLGAGNARLAYRLYADAGLSREIPIGGNLSIDYGNPDDIRLPIHAALQLPGNQSAGRYQDRLTVTLSW